MSLRPAVLRRLMKEIAQLKNEPLEGIRVSSPDEDMLDVTGIIEGPAGTPYEGGYFRVKFAFTEEFPSAPPRCRLITKIFHPNVSSAGEICVNTLKKDWQSTYGIGHILVTIKCLLIYPNPESALDEEAGKELLEDYENYCRRAKLITSVHATPRTRPAEFDIPSVIPDSSPSSEASSSSNKVDGTADSAPATFPVVTISTLNPPPSFRKSVSPAPQHAPQPLQSSFTVSNVSSVTSPTLAEKEGGGKEMKSVVSIPSPLGTADANNPLVGNAHKMLPDATAAATKSLKRPATTSGASGEKRKKALKRL
ncbi:hypothetical protein SCHPADRAFT_899519 [Schizopora paradoxa]|uniref:E2 ubiquitin-conjugating enzyme n=1 Tax=Schizopora paradoxa TaxID=27342 RepID=A0A0H2S344_9AGAM|nr:hypothetical protein SCHPADRAFT_899519 [Schizopora paradoxa]